ncbi:MAG: SDR family oxidoreductase [Pararhodobacter sp.]|nr:SDR family oxidoreductase [Pararhodobacter sp.]
MSMTPATAGAPFALVTGGAGGIGWAICQRLARAGYRVIIADLDSALAHQRAAPLGAAQAVLAVDLTDAQAAGSLIDRALVLARGRLQLVVNNAGMTDSGGHALCVMPDAAFDQIIALNLTAVERICAAALERLAPGGVVINIASGAAWRPLPLRGPYSATKAALVALTETLAAPFAAHGLRIGAVAPGYTLTPLVEELARAGRVDLGAVAAGIPLGRLARPEDIAHAVAFMASSEGAVLDGRTLPVDGGISQGQAAPATAAPAPGRHEAPGTVAWLGHPPAKPDALALSSLSALKGIRPLAAVVDAGVPESDASPASMLARAREIARACAAHPARCRDFSLTFVIRTGTKPAERAAQAGQAMLARTLALEWAGAGMRVNALNWREDNRKRDGMGLEELCSFLCSPEAGYITGQTIDAGQGPAQAGPP